MTRGPNDARTLPKKHFVHAQVHIIYPKFIRLSFRKLDNPLDLQH